jgi:hypothetical protein
VGPRRFTIDGHAKTRQGGQVDERQQRVDLHEPEDALKTSEVSDGISDADGFVEVTCSRDVCHVVFVIAARDLPTVIGANCPDCHAGVLERRERPTPDGSERLTRGQAPPWSDRRGSCAVTGNHQDLARPSSRDRQTSAWGILRGHADETRLTRVNAGGHVTGP